MTQTLISTITQMGLYFLVGVVQDFFFTMNSRYVAKDKTAPAVVSSLITVVISMLVLYNILNGLDPQKSITAILCYSAGIAAGTYLAMKFKFGFKD